MSKRAKEYIEENTELADNLVDLYGWGLFNVVEEYDARHAIELAEEEMVEKAGHIFAEYCEMYAGEGKCLEGGDCATCKRITEFKQKLMEE